MSEPTPLASDRLDRGAVNALAGEILGAGIHIESAPGVSPLPLDGTIVDESLHTLVIRRPGHARTRRVAKAGLSGTILLGERQLPLKGEILRVRPEDRTKRLSVPGRRRFR